MIEVRFAKPGDLGEIAKCHQQAFPDSLTSKLGTRFLKVLFSWYLSTSQTALWIVEQDLKIIGYCGSMISDGTSAHGSASSMTQYTFSALVYGMLSRPWLMFHPEFYGRFGFIIRNLKYRLTKMVSKKVIRSASPGEPYVGLVVIGVIPQKQGMGHASALMKELDNIAKARGIRKLQLSVRSDNSKAIRAYEKSGWVTLKLSGTSTVMQKIIDL